MRSFNFIGAKHPTGSLLLASDGKLYGSTSKGGSRDEGVLFFYDIECSTFKKLLDLQSHSGVNTLSTLIEYPANPKIASRIMAAPPTQIAGTSLFTIKVSPNPSSTNFTVEIQSALRDETVEIVVTDISGRRLYQRTGASSEKYRFGELLTAGVYFVRVKQGQNIQTLKVIKAGTNSVK
ncbi:MAG: T9SS type A sorting domain-containing protein [Ferruginibacter sp.]